MKQREVTNFAKGGGNLIASLCKIGYFPHRMFGMFLFKIKIFMYKLLEQLPYCKFTIIRENFNFTNILEFHLSQIQHSRETFEPLHEKTCFMPYANNKGADQPMHLRSLISNFVIHCLDSIIPTLTKSKTSRL